MQRSWSPVAGLYIDWISGKLHRAYVFADASNSISPCDSKPECGECAVVGQGIASLGVNLKETKCFIAAKTTTTAFRTQRIRLPLRSLCSSSGGQDRFAYMAVKYYADLISSDPSMPAEMVDAIRLHANKMYEWQSKYGKTPDCPAGELVRL